MTTRSQTHKFQIMERPLVNYEDLVKGPPVIIEHLVLPQSVQNNNALLENWGAIFGNPNLTECDLPRTVIDEYLRDAHRRYPQLRDYVPVTQNGQAPVTCEQMQRAALELNQACQSAEHPRISIPAELLYIPPLEVDPDDNYQNVPVPPQEDFLFGVTPQNGEFIQASIVTGRGIYPSFSMYLEWALTHRDYIVRNTVSYRNDQNMDRLFQRSTYPLYLRDASTYEVFSIYNHRDAQALVNLVHAADDEVNYMNDINRHGYESWQEQDPQSYAKSFASHIEAQGYRFAYFKYVKHLPDITYPKDRYFPQRNLTPDNLRATLTADQLILIEGWRQRALNPLLTTVPRSYNYNTKVLGLDVIRDKIRPNPSDRTHCPVISNVGYPAEELQRAVENVNYRLQDRGMGSLTRQYIIRQGESAISTAGHSYIHPKTGKETITTKDRDITHRPLPMWGTKSYYMMLYLELAARGFINEHGQVAI